MASLEGGHLIADSIGVLQAFHSLGVRYMTLAHFASNSYADSMTGEVKHNGLSKAGRELVREMNRMGMMVDVSHISDKAVLDAVEESKSPVMASHSSAKAVTPIVRNMPDDVIKAIAKKGGVMCINFHAGISGRARVQRLLQESARARQGDQGRAGEAAQRSLAMGDRAR